MEFFDRKFRDYWLSYVIQCMLATLAVFVVLLILDIVLNAAIIAALGGECVYCFYDALFAGF